MSKRDPPRIQRYFHCLYLGVKVIWPCRQDKLLDQSQGPQRPDPVPTVPEPALHLAPIPASLGCMLHEVSGVGYMLHVVLILASPECMLHITPIQASLGPGLAGLD